MSEARIERGGEGELRLIGVLDYRSGPALREAGRALIAGSRAPLTLDCSAVERSSSVGLSLLLAFMRDAKAAGIDLRVSALPGDMYKIAKVSGLLDILPLEASGFRKGCRMKLRWAENLRDSLHELAESLGNLLVESFHYLALFAIGAVTAWAAVMAFLGMVEKGHITIDDILLLFIYLELGAMVGIYFKTNHMPVRFLIYVAITALTRLLISDISHHHRPDMGVVYVSGAILLLALAILVVRFASSRFPAVQSDSGLSRIGASAIRGRNAGLRSVRARRLPK